MNYRVTVDAGTLGSSPTFKEATRLMNEIGRSHPNLIPQLKIEAWNAERGEYVICGWHTIPSGKTTERHPLF